MSPLAPAGNAQRVATSVSLVVGPPLVSVGDLLHPEKRMLPAEQIAIVVDHASRWYTAHLPLDVGMLLFIPGLIGLSTLTARLKPVQGYATRILIMIGTAGFASIITGEMLASRLVLDGVGNAAPISLWTNLFMGPVAAAVGPPLLAFFVGTFMFAILLLRGSERLRRPVALIVIGALFVLAEISTARVLFSQIGCCRLVRKRRGSVADRARPNRWNRAHFTFCAHVAVTSAAWRHAGSGSASKRFDPS